MPSPPAARRRGLWQKRYAIPTEHGLWTWWLGPLLIGIAASKCPGWDSVLLLVAGLASFFLHQPAAIAVRALAGRGARADLGPASTWAAVHGGVALLAVVALVLRGHHRFVWLMALGLPFFAFHLWLVYRNVERRQMAVEMIGAGVLALWAPAAYWVGGGTHYPEPWILWLLCWTQSVGAIANVYLRLEQRSWKAVPPLADRLYAGRKTLVQNGAAMAAAILFALLGQAPWGVVPAFLVPLLDALDSTFRPMRGAMPRRIGFRQLFVWLAWLAVMLAAYLAR